MKKEEWVELLKIDFPESIGKELDPNDEFDWLSITIGWAIAKGMRPKQAIKFAEYVRYQTDLM